MPDSTLTLVHDAPQALAESDQHGLAVADDPSLYAGGIGAVTLAEPEREVMDRPVETDRVAITPTGEVYIPHEWYRTRFREAIGVGSFGQRVLGSWGEQDGDDTIIYVRLALFIRGSFAASAIGSHKYRPKNKRMDYSDAFEAAESNAFVRCCKRVGLGLEPWSPSFRKEFVKARCIKVLVRDDRGGIVARWRLKSDDPMEGEIPPSKDNKPPVDSSATGPAAAAQNPTPPASAAATPTGQDGVIDLDQPAAKASAKQIARLGELTAGMNPDAVKASLKQRRVKSFEELTAKQASNIIEKLEEVA